MTTIVPPETTRPKARSARTLFKTFSVQSSKFRVPSFPLGVADFDRLFERRNGVVSHRRRVLVRDEAGELQLGDRFHDEAVVQLLSLVDVVTTGVAAGMEVSDPL